MNVYLLLYLIVYPVLCFQTLLINKNPCMNKKIRIFIVASNCFSDENNVKFIKSKYSETIFPFIDSVLSLSAKNQIYLVKFCLIVSDTILTKSNDLSKEIFNDIKWIKFGAHKILYQKALIQANVMASKLALSDKELFQNLFITVAQGDHRLAAAALVQPESEFNYRHFLFYMQSSLPNNVQIELSKQSGLPSEFIILLDNKQYKGPIENSYVCSGYPYDHSCINKFSCANNLICLENKCKCSSNMSLPTPNEDFCRLNIFQPCYHTHSCYLESDCEKRFCRARMPPIVCPFKCKSGSRACPSNMHCGLDDTCEYLEKREWFKWTENTVVVDKRALMKIYRVQYYWIIITAVAFLITLVGIPLIIVYRIKRNTLVPAEIRETLTVIQERVTERMSQLGTATRNTFSRINRNSSLSERKGVSEIDDDI